MALQLNLEKSKAALQLCLHKAGVTQPPVMDMGVLLDVSGSFEDEHQDGTTNRLLTRLIPWGLTFDPDGKLDVTTFSHGERHVHRVGSVTAANYADFVQRQVIGRVPGWNGGIEGGSACAGFVANVRRRAGVGEFPSSGAGFVAIARRDRVGATKPAWRSISHPPPPQWAGAMTPPADEAAGRDRAKSRSAAAARRGCGLRRPPAATPGSGRASR